VIIARGGHAVPSFDFPESAALAQARVARYAEWRRRPEGNQRVFDDVDVASARRLVEAALAGASDDPAAQLLACYGIATGPAVDATAVDMMVEVILDPLFGHLLAVGPAGANEREFRSLPLTDVDAEDLLRTVPPTAASSAFGELLLRVSRLVEDVPEVAELRLGVVLAPAGPGVVAGAGALRLAPWRIRPERAVRRLR
jgi:acyl-CoA synthetase (NDP forming)